MGPFPVERSGDLAAVDAGGCESEDRLGVARLSYGCRQEDTLSSSRCDCRESERVGQPLPLVSNWWTEPVTSESYYRTPMPQTPTTLDIAEVRPVRCDVCRQDGDRALSLGSAHLARSGDVVFIPLDRLSTREHRSIAGLELDELTPIERRAAKAADSELSEAERAALADRYVDGSPILVGPDGLTVECWNGHAIGPTIRATHISLYLGASE